MLNMHYYRGQTISYDGLRYRIIDINIPANTVVVIDMDYEEASPEYWNYDVMVEYVVIGLIREIADPFKANQFLSEEEFRKSDKEQRDMYWPIIGPLWEANPRLFLNRKQWRTINSICRKKAKKLGFKRSNRTFERKTRIFLQGGMHWNALLGNYHKCGAPGRRRTGTAKNDGTTSKRGRPPLANDVFDTDNFGLNVTDKIREIFDQTFKKYVIKKHFEPFDAYKQMLRDYFYISEKDIDDIIHKRKPPPGNIPRYEQFEYWRGIDQDPVETNIAQEGPREHQKNTRRLKRRGEEAAHGVGDIYLIDATLADIYLVSEYDRSRIIGRPILYLVVDAFTGMIVGLAVTLEGPSWEGAKLALENAIRDKVAFCQEYGVDIHPDEWPAVGRPASILVDNSEFASYNSDNVVRLEIKLTNTPVRRPDLKGLVEGMFGLLNKFDDWKPGANYPDVPRDGYILDGKYTIREFIEIMIRRIIHFNTKKPSKYNLYAKQLIKEGKYPMRHEIWHWGVANYGSYLNPIDNDRLMANLLATKTGRISDFGLNFKGLEYEELDKKSTKLDKLVRRYRTLKYQARKKRKKKKRKGGKQKPLMPVDVAYHPGNLNYIYWKDKSSLNFTVCKLQKREDAFLNMAWDDLRDHRALITGHAEDQLLTEVEAEGELLRHEDAITKNAKVATKAAQAGMSKAERKRGIRANKASEKAVNRKNDANRVHSSITGEIQPDGPPEAENMSSTQTEVSKPPKHYYRPRPSRFKLINEGIEVDELEVEEDDNDRS